MADRIGQRVPRACFIALCPKDTEKLIARRASAGVHHQPRQQRQFARPSRQRPIFNATRVHERQAPERREPVAV
jgi:hypothetical protein